MPKLRETETTRPTDDIDRIVAVLLNDPGRADDMKHLLRQKMKAPSSVRVAVPRVPVRAMAEDVEDMWDNVPV